MQYRPVVITKPIYVYLKLIPNKSIRNNQTARILQFVAEMFTNMQDRVDIDFKNKQIKYEERSKIAYYIYMTKQQIEFYFIVAEKYAELLKQRIEDVWRKLVTIIVVDDIPRFETYKYYLDYKYEDALSTRIDNRDNDLLTSILNASTIMHDGDQAGILFNFTPIYQKGWLTKYNKTIDKVNNDSPYYKDKINPFSILFIINDLLIKLLDEIFNRKPEKQSRSFSISDYTKDKKKSTIVATQIVCAGNNRDVNISLCEAFHIIDNDNQIVKYYRSKKLDYDKYNLGCSKMFVSTNEAQSFVSLPGDSLLKEHKIEHVDILEKKVPEELQNGYIGIGTNTCRGVETKAYLMDDIQIGAMPLVLDGEQGAGKTSYIANYIKYTQTRNEGCIVIDFIKNCELSETIKKAIPSDRIIEVDMSDIDMVQGIGYNELKPKSNKTAHIVDCANTKAMYISRLIDAMNINGDVLSARMDRYLNAASNIVMCSEDASLKDIVRFLNEYHYREALLKKLPKVLAKELEEEITAIRELDEIDSKTGKVVDTKYSKIDGINDRISLLKKDYRLKKMFNKNCNDNINLVEAMEQGKVVLFKMPQMYFSTPYSKNVVVTYLYTKIWAASVVRGMMHDIPKRCHIITDEVFQTKTAMHLIQEEQILPQTRKFQTRFVFSCQYLKQIEEIADMLDAAGSSYMLMKGSSKANFNEFKDMITPFTLEDLQSLKQYHSLNIINTNDGKKVFVTKLPKPI